MRGGDSRVWEKERVAMTCATERRSSTVVATDVADVGIRTVVVVVAVAVALWSPLPVAGC